MAVQEPCNREIEITVITTKIISDSKCFSKSVEYRSVVSVIAATSWDVEVLKLKHLCFSLHFSRARVCVNKTLPNLSIYAIF